MKILLAIVAFVFPLGVFAAGGDFSRLLGQGMQGEDVRQLQKLLNKDPETRIAEYGVGSPGNETMYFGLGTKRALIKFQEKYAAEILVPSGFSVGTGFFGSKTREKIMSLLGGNTPVSSSVSTPSVFAVKSSKEPALPSIDRKEFTISLHGLKTYAEFYQEFGTIGTRITFSPEEMAGMKKIQMNTGLKGEVVERVATLEELIDLLKNGEPVDSLRPSFIAWKNLSERTIAELKKIPVTYYTLEVNQEMTSWFTYYAQTADRLSKGGLTTEQIGGIAREFEILGKSHQKVFGANINKTESETPGTFSFVNRAQAFTCAAFQGPIYNFGGRILAIVPCDFGILDYVSPPCGGIMFFTFPVLAANPFMAKWGPYVPSAAVLGRSFAAPGVCPIIIVPHPYEAVVIYFGASAGPGV